MPPIYYEQTLLRIAKDSFFLGCQGQKLDLSLSLRAVELPAPTGQSIMCRYS